MASMLNIMDGSGRRHHIRTEYDNPNLIGEHYPVENVKIKTLKNAICQTYLHYLGTPGWGMIKKEPIPKDTTLLVKNYWVNFYGDYFRVEYNGEPYDISTNDVVIL